MSLTKLSDSELLKNTKELVKRERELTHQVIAHLEEIDARKLYCDLKCSSLFDYCLKELSYSEDEACRRISAMRFIKKNPEVTPKVIEGKLTLSSLNLLSTFQKNNQNADIQKVASEIENKSKKEAEIIIRAQDVSSTPAPMRTSVKEIDEHVRIHLTLTKSTYEKLQKIQGLKAHKKILGMEELLDQMCDQVLILEEKKHTLQKSAPALARVTTTRYIPKAVKDHAYKSAHGKCVKCGSIFMLEYNHKLAFAKGGTSSKENIELTCRPATNGR